MQHDRESQPPVTAARWPALSATRRSDRAERVSAVPFDLPTCLARVACGDEQAAEELVAHTHPMVLKLVRAHRSQYFSDEDLVQEVYLKMFARLDRYSPREAVPFEHWLSRLAVNTCRDALRGESRRPRLSGLSQESQARFEALDHGEASSHAARELVDLLLAQLSPDDRLVLTLLDLEQRPVAEIARLTGWSSALIKVRAFRARRKLRAIAQRREQRGRP